eukprot:gb/GECG01004920.1/.p1 GENE.gb/GECG01004920.1/~~gb/GECG01004920.1/.p1  ORF type:complete len:1120 (+),score=148.89 gb/GECG01004920.1/:1-3360(+)
MLTNSKMSSIQEANAPDRGESDAYIPSAISTSMEAPSSASMMASFTSTRASVAKSKKSKPSKSPQEKLSSTFTGITHAEKKMSKSSPKDFLSSSSQSILMPGKHRQNSNARVHKRPDLKTASNTTKKPPRKSHPPSHRTPLANKSANRSNTGRWEESYSAGAITTSTHSSSNGHCSAFTNYTSSSSIGNSCTTGQKTHSSGASENAESNGSQYSVEIIRRLRASVQKLLEEETTGNNSDESRLHEEGANQKEDISSFQSDGVTMSHIRNCEGDEMLSAAAGSSEIAERPERNEDTIVFGNSYTDEEEERCVQSSKSQKIQERLNVDGVSKSTSFPTTQESDATTASWSVRTAGPIYRQLEHFKLTEDCNNYPATSKCNYATSLSAGTQQAVHESAAVAGVRNETKPVQLSDRHLRLLRVQQSNWSSDYFEDLTKKYNVSTRRSPDFGKSADDDSSSADESLILPVNVKKHSANLSREDSSGGFSDIALPPKDYRFYGEKKFHSSQQWSIESDQTVVDTVVDSQRASGERNSVSQVFAEVPHSEEQSKTSSVDECRDVELVPSGMGDLGLESPIRSRSHENPSIESTLTCLAGSSTLQIVRMPSLFDISNTWIANADLEETTGKPRSPTDKLEKTEELPQSQDVSQHIESITAETSTEDVSTRKCQELVHESSLLQHHFHESTEATSRMSRDSDVPRLQVVRLSQNPSESVISDSLPESCTSRASMGMITNSKLYQSSRVVFEEVQCEETSKRGCPVERGTSESEAPDLKNLSSVAYANQASGDPKFTSMTEKPQHSKEVQCVETSNRYLSAERGTSESEVLDLEDLSSVASSSQPSGGPGFTPVEVAAETTEQSDSHEKRSEIGNSGHSFTTCSKYSDTALTTAAKALVEQEDEQSYREAAIQEVEEDQHKTHNPTEPGRSAAFMAAMGIEVPKRRYKWNCNVRIDSLNRSKEVSASPNVQLGMCEQPQESSRTEDGMHAVRTSRWSIDRGSTSNLEPGNPVACEQPQWSSRSSFRNAAARDTYQESSEDLEVCTMLNDDQMVSNVGRDVLLNPCSRGYRYSSTLVGNNVPKNSYEEALRDASTIKSTTYGRKEPSVGASRPSRRKKAKAQRHILKGTA